MGSKSRRKGASGEREAANELSRITGRPWRRAVGQSRSGADMPDVEREDGATEAWAEVKRQKRPNWRAAMKQAREAAPEGEPCWVLTRDDHGAWVLHVELAEVWSLHRLASDAERVRRVEHAKEYDVEDVERDRAYDAAMKARFGHMVDALYDDDPRKILALDPRDASADGTED